ncbi:MAG: hypothetical protein QM756_43930 [Polyangiaceae bacterium]
MEDFADSDPIGVVEGQASKPIRLDDWIAWIARDSRLQPPDAVQSVNPFSREVLIIAPHPGTAYVLEKQAQVGMMAWSEEGSDEIVVYGRTPPVLALAAEVAKELGGRFRLLGAP